MKQYIKLTVISTLLILCSSPTAFAETAAANAAGGEASKSRGSKFKTIGVLYTDKENRWVQEFKVFGRYQFQAAYIDGNDVNGNGFDDIAAIHRRFRFGAQMKFAQYFTAKANVNLVVDARFAGLDVYWGVPDGRLAAAAFDVAKLTFDAGKAFDVAGLDSLKITYGRQKLKMSQEAHTSSKKIKTIERSALANTIYRSARPVGFTVDAAKDSWKGTFALFSDQISSNKWDAVIGEWSDGIAWYASATKTLANDDQLVFDFVYHDDSGAAILNWFGYDWAASVFWSGSRGRWGFMGNVIAGDHGDFKNHPERGGLFYGAVLMGTYSILQGTLEAVGQYQWQGSENAEGVRTNSRIFRGDNGGDVNGGRGDSHHSLYGGLNWYIYGDHAKFMAAVDYQNLAATRGNADAITLWLAFRTYF